MAPMQIKHVVSFSSQDPKNCVENLCVVDRDTRSWLCSPQDRSGVLRAELQLERATYIGYIDVGNCGSAFIQIDVGRSSWPVEQAYTTLLPTATLMNPVESRQGTGRMGVRMFKKEDFLSEAAADRWDRVRVTCTQPFNVRAQFGLSFLRIRSPEVENEGVSPEQSGPESPGQRTPDKAASAVRQWLSSPAVQRTFFGPSQSVSEKAQKTLVGMSRSARMVLTASQANRHPPPPSLCSTPTGAPNTATSPSAEVHTSTPSSAKADAQTRNVHPHTASKACLISFRSPKDSTPLGQLKRKPNCKNRQNQINSTPRCKRKKSAANKGSPSPVSTPSPPHSPPEPKDTEDNENTCPICGVFFPPQYLPFHASSCQGADTEVLPGVMTPLSPSPDPHSSPEEDMLPCPLCSFRFPASHIQLHASMCGDDLDSHVIWVD